MAFNATQRDWVWISTLSHVSPHNIETHILKSNIHTYLHITQGDVNATRTSMDEYTVMRSSMHATNGVPTDDRGDEEEEENENSEDDMKAACILDVSFLRACYVCIHVYVYTKGRVRRQRKQRW